jgi:DNA-binding CsgD family transcriptional regulator
VDHSSFILKTIREVYDGVVEPELNSQAFESVCKSVGGERLFFFTEDLQSCRLQFLAGLGVAPDYFQRLTLAAEAKILPPGLLNMPSGTVKLGKDFWLKQSYEKSAFYNEVVRPNGGHHGIVAAPLRQNRYVAFLAVERLRGQADFDYSDVAMLRAIVPHLRNALLVRLKLEDLEHTARQSKSVFDLVDIGVFIVDSELHPVFMNRFAECLIKERDGLALTQTTLHTADPNITRALRSEVRAAIALHARRPHRQLGVEDVAKLGVRLEIPRVNQKPPLIAIVMPLSVATNHKSLAPASRAVILVKRHAEAPQFDIAELQRRLGLTPRQAQLAVLLAQGITLSEAGKVLGIAMETVRWHLREIFERTGTCRQLDLVRLVLHGPTHKTLAADNAC